MPPGALDFIKADDISRPTHHQEIAAIHKAIQNSRPPHGAQPFARPGPRHRRSVPGRERQHVRRFGRLRDDWKLLRENFTLLAIWSGFGRPGAWPDADMLPLAAWDSGHGAA